MKLALEPALSVSEAKDSLVWVSSLLFLGIIVIFSPVMLFPFVTLDDPSYVSENPNVRSGLSLTNLVWAFSALHGNISYWHPITWISHQIDSQLFGLQAGAHHLTNVLFHAANSTLVFALVRKLRLGFYSALFVAAIFAVHPLHVESVAWVSERKDVLCGLFYLSALNLYLDFRSRGGIGSYVASIACAALASMSKPTAVTLPVVLILLDWLVLGRTGPERNPRFGRYSTVWRCLPFVAIGLAVAAITVIAQQRIGAVQSLAALPLAERLDNTWLAYVTYVRRFLWPTDLSVAYGLDPAMSRFGMLALIPVAAASLLAWSWRKNSGLGAFGWFAFLAMLLPTIGLIQAGPQFTADRYMYLPILGLTLVVVEILRRLQAPIRFQWTWFMAGASTCVALAVATMAQLMHWKDSVSLFARAVELQPEFWFARLGFGTALTSVGKYDEALEQFQHALRLPGNAAETHRMIGVCLFPQRRYAEALEHFRRSHELKPSINAALMLAHLYSGHDDGSLRDGPQALQFAEQARQHLSHLDGPTLLIMAAAHASAGHFGKATQFLDLAVEEGKRQGNDFVLREAEKRRRVYGSQVERSSIAAREG